MAKTKSKTSNSTALTVNDKLSNFLKTNQENHYNFEEDIDYKVSYGSLVVDFELQGGIGPGLHRFTGMNEGGKTSAALELMRNFLNTVPNSRGFYIKAEGRLSQNMKDRSGVEFTNKPEEWQNGNCFVFECNVYETVVEAMRNLVYDNSEDIRYFFLLDSVDGLITKNDAEKSFEECSKVAGGAVIAATFMKRVSIALAKRGHMAVFVSQVRADIKLDPYSKAPIRQTTATGGNALLHFANYIFEFEPRFKTDMILQKPLEKYDPQKNPYIGHYAKITVKKSPNEKTNSVIRYPIIYGRIGGKSIWNEKEILDMLYLWGHAEKKGAWISISADLRNEALEHKIEIPETIQGENKFNTLVEEDEKIKNFFIKYFRDLILSE
jgi:RecA/RadA recombinase